MVIVCSIVAFVDDCVILSVETDSEKSSGSVVLADAKELARDVVDIAFSSSVFPSSFASVVLAKTVVLAGFDVLAAYSICVVLAGNVEIGE